MTPAYRIQGLSVLPRRTIAAMPRRHSSVNDRTALPMTSAGRLWAWGPSGMGLIYHIFGETNEGTSALGPTGGRFDHRCLRSTRDRRANGNADRLSPSATFR